MVSYVVLQCVPAIADFRIGRQAYESEDYATAVKELSPAAQQNNIDAQVMLVIIYLKSGALQNYQAALKWSRLAAATGDARAQFYLGVMYAKGVLAYLGRTLQRRTVGTISPRRTAMLPAQIVLAPASTDSSEAVNWYRAAASQGNADAQERLAELYEIGAGVPIDYLEAVRWS